MPTLPIDTQDATVFEFLKNKKTYQTEGQIAKGLDCPIERVKDSLTQLEGFRMVVRHGNKLDQWVIEGILDDALETFKKIDKLKEGVEGKEFKPEDYATLITIKEHFACTRDSQDLYIYSNGLYIPGESYVHEKAIDVLQNGQSKHRVNEILFYIQATNYKERKEFDEKPEIINLSNGLLDVSNFEFKEHTPHYLSLTKVPVMYSPEARCDKFLHFLSEIIEEGDIKTIQELFGYCLWKRYDNHKAFMFLGDGANGKSTLINIMKIFLGADNCASIPLQEFGFNRFSHAELYGKLANLQPDLPSKKIMYSGMFKALTGEDMVKGERKWGKPFYFTNFAKQVFSANQLPEVEDQSDAFFRRWIIINFPNKFEGEARKKNIVEELIDEKELSGILNWALDGLKRLNEKNDFSDAMTTDQIREDYIKKSDPPAAFVMDCVTVVSGTEVKKDEFYSAYVKYCGKNKLPVISKVVFARDHLPRLIPTITAAKRGPKGDRYWVWVGAQICDDFGVQDVKLMLDTEQKNLTGTENQDESDSVQSVQDIDQFNKTRTRVNSNSELKEGKGKEKSNMEGTIENILDTKDATQKDRLVYLLQEIKNLENKYQSTVFKSELLQEYETRKWTEAMLDEDLNTLMKDGIIYDPNRSERYKVV